MSKVPGWSPGCTRYGYQRTTAAGDEQGCRQKACTSRLFVLNAGQACPQPHTYGVPLSLAVPAPFTVHQQPPDQRPCPPIHPPTHLKAVVLSRPSSRAGR